MKPSPADRLQPERAGPERPPIAAAMAESGLAWARDLAALQARLFEQCMTFAADASTRMPAGAPLLEMARRQADLARMIGEAQSRMAGDCFEIFRHALGGAPGNAKLPGATPALEAESPAAVKFSIRAEGT